jgi:predicted metalloenzyme YecM
MAGLALQAERGAQHGGLIETYAVYRGKTGEVIFHQYELNWRYRDTNIEQVIGDYGAFASDLMARLAAVSIDIKGLPLSHITYRVATLGEYAEMRDELKGFCREFVETQFNGRAISILLLKTDLILAEGCLVSTIELPAPRSVHVYPVGLEHIGIIIGKTLPQFKIQHQNVLTGEKDHGALCRPAFITFNNGKTVKFYDHSLKEIMLSEGWKFQKLI